jgi:nucleoside-diphosphate-sugar epimerase
MIAGMRVFLVGAASAIGRRLVPLLAERGDAVLGTTTSAAKTEEIAGLGAEPVVLDLLDRAATVAAIVTAKPDVVIHQATALSGSFDVKNVDRFFTQTNKLRTIGTDNLLAAAREAEVRRVIVQSYTGWPNARGHGLANEDDPLEPRPANKARQTVAAIGHVESVVPAMDSLEGVVLRYGSFYGPGTSMGPDGDVTERVRTRQFPIVGDGGGVWSFVHIDDAAAATVAAIEQATPGLYNICDDEPAPVREWLPVFAEAVGAKPPMRVPAWIARVAIGENGLRMMTAIRGSSNAKAKRELGWEPAHPSWRQGFRTL